MAGDHVVHLYMEGKQRMENARSQAFYNLLMLHNFLVLPYFANVNMHFKIFSFDMDYLGCKIGS